MRIGFTGTREGMVDAQARAFKAWFAANWPDEFHMGCCVGADDDATTFVASLNTDALLNGRKRCRIIGHPPDNKVLLSANAMVWCDELREPRPYLVRDQDIVNESDQLTATPKGMVEEQRSGTWATVRMARRGGKVIVAFWPDGTVTEEPAK